MAVLRFFALTLALAALYFADAAPPKTAEEESPFGSIFRSLNEQFQNATQTAEQMLGVNIPSTQEELQTAIKQNLDTLKQSAEGLQKKLSEYSVTGSSVSEVLRQAQTKLDTTVKDLSKGSPDLTNMLEQVKRGYNGLADVGQKVGTAVQEQAGGAQADLRALAENAKTELQTAATKLQAQVNDLMTAQSKKTT